MIYENIHINRTKQFEKATSKNVKYAFFYQDGLSDKEKELNKRDDKNLIENLIGNNKNDNKIENDIIKKKVYYIPPLYPIPSIRMGFFPCDSNKFNKEKKLKIFLYYTGWKQDSTISGDRFISKQQLVINYLKKRYDIELSILIENEKSECLIKNNKEDQSDITFHYSEICNYREILNLIQSADICITYGAPVFSGSSVADMISLGKPVIYIADGRLGKEWKQPHVNPLFKYPDTLIYIQERYEESIAKLEIITKDFVGLHKKYVDSMKNMEFKYWKKFMIDAINDNTNTINYNKAEQTQKCCIAEWLKSEDSIYEKLKKDKRTENIYTGIDSIRDAFTNHMVKSIEDWSSKSYYCAPSSWYVKIPQGIETDNDKLKPITIALLNWERQYYIPYVLDMYNNQDYPKDLIEILIIDDNSVDKKEVLNIVKEQAKLYPELKMRFIQNYVDICQGPPKRTNMGVRLASHNIVIINESDNLPLGKNYLRGICHDHNEFKNIMSIGIPISFTHYKDLNDVFRHDTDNYTVMNRFGNGVFTFDKELFSKIRGFDEKHIGWGGHEANICSRYLGAGGKLFLNLNIFSGNLPNFPIEPKSQPAGGGLDDWQKGIIINDENWGLTEKYEEIDLYNEV